MANLVIPEATALHVMRYSWLGRQNTMTCSLASEWQSGDESLDNLVTEYVARWHTAWSPHANDTVTLYEWHTLGRDEAGVLSEVTRAVQSIGQQDVTISPPNCAVIVHKRTSLPGRAGRGRMYVPGWAHDYNTDEVGNLTPATVGSINDSLLDFWDVFQARVPLSRPLLLHKTALAPNLIDVLNVDATLGTQRRRLR